MKTILALLFAISTLAVADQERDEWHGIINAYKARQITLPQAERMLLAHVAKYFPGDQEFVDIVNEHVRTERARLAEEERQRRIRAAVLDAKLREQELRQAVQNAVDDAMMQHRHCR